MLGEDIISQIGEKYDLTGIDLWAPKTPGINFFNCDISKQQRLAEIFQEVKPWLIIHAAAYTDVDACEQDSDKADLINAQGTKNIVDVCKNIKAKLIFVSTDYVFDGTKGSPYQETDPVSPINKYGYSKLAGENFVRAGLDEFLIIRTSWLFGRGGKNFVDTIIGKAKREKQLKVVDDQRGSPTHTVSLALGIEKLIDSVFQGVSASGNYGIYHLTNSEHCSWCEFAKEIVKLKKLPTKIIPIDSSAIRRPAKRPVVSILDNSRYQRVTGHTLCRWQEALKEYLK